ncbi:MAG: glycosyltransferase, partial [Flavobacteriaceae bacterium]|nr:glycosyltransferase [Flavobacteriaceae bacterium]
YTMSWIHRQLNSYGQGESIVLCQTRENEEIFPIDTVYVLGEEAYWSRALKAKLNFWFGRRPIKMAAQQKREIITLFKKHDIQLLHAHFGTYGIYFAKLCKELDIPLLVTFHGHDISSAFERWPAYKQAFRSLLENITYAIVISEEMKARLLKLGCPEEKAKVSYLGVPLDEFPYVDRPEREKTIFLHAGRLTAKKGVPALVEAFHAAFGDNTSVAELWIAGDGEEKGKVDTKIMDLNLSDSVKLLGRLSDKELLVVRHQADVFVLNCRTDAAGTKEGLPISTLEAAATGLPAISTYHAGIPESIIDGETGFLVPEYDNKALTLAMQRMMDRALRKEMGRKARAFMEKKFDLAQCNEVLYQLYEKAVRS